MIRLPIHKQPIGIGAQHIVMKTMLALYQGKEIAMSVGDRHYAALGRLVSENEAEAYGALHVEAAMEDSEDVRATKASVLS